jgi:hypothetical protein
MTDRATPAGRYYATLTDPRVQTAWARVLDAMNDYGKACLDAAADPQTPEPVLTDTVHAARLDHNPGGDPDHDTLTLLVSGPRGRFGSPYALTGKRLVIYDDD